MLKEIKVPENIKCFDAFQLLRADMLSYPLLKPEEEKILFGKYIFGKKCKLELSESLEKQLPINDSLLESIQIGIDAREKLINSNLRLVMGLAYHYSATDGENHKIEDDVVHNFFSGCEGLIKAVDQFKFERGTRLSTYAFPKIVKAITENLRWNTIYAPRYIREMATKYNKIIESYQIINGKPPADEYIIKTMKITQTSLDKLRVSLEANFGRSLLETDHDKEGYFEDKLIYADFNSEFYEGYFGRFRPTEYEASDNIMNSEINPFLYQFLKGALNTKVKAMIFTHLFILEETNMSKIAETCGVSPQYVSAEKKRLLESLKNNQEFVSFCIEYLGLRG